MKMALSDPSLALADAIPMAESILGGTYNDHPATLEYIIKDDASAALAHVVQIRNQTTGAWVEAFVDAHTGELLSVTDFVAHASVSRGHPRWDIAHDCAAVPRSAVQR